MMLKLKYNMLLGFLLLIFYSQNIEAQEVKSAKEYLKRAETMYDLIWKSYWIPKHGLFSENYPSGRKDTLTYFQGAAVSEKEVSFLWPFSGMFTATNVLMKHTSLKNKYKPYLEQLVTGVEKYRDTTRKPAGYQAYPSYLEYSDRYYDDNGLVGIDYMESYFNTKDELYLKRAKEVFTFILSGWDDELGGGVTWLEGHRDQKPACSNGMAMLTALKIYQGSKDKYYLNWGIKFYDWMYKHLRDSSVLYANDIKPGNKVNKTYYSYNSGSMLEASIILYELTKDEKYLVEAKAIAEATYNHFSIVNANGERELKIDLPWFITVLFRGYESLYHVDQNEKYLLLIEDNLNKAWANSKDKYGLLTAKWTNNKEALDKPKWLLDEACIVELYARLSLIRMKN